MKTRLACLALVVLFGCRSNSNSPVDSKSTIDGTSTIDAPAGACASYTTSTVAAMRQATPGCYKLVNVVSLGVTPSTKSPQLYVQDAGGGDFSAMLTKCSSTSTAHPCTVNAVVAAIANGHSVTITGTYIRTSSTTFEEFFIDSITDNGATTAPAAATATLADIERSGAAKNLRFQRVTLNILPADMLQMYDWTPSEFVNSGATACPYQFAFAMLPKSVTGQTAAGACAGSASQPAGVTSPSASEVLIGTDFFKGFTASSDCRCAKTFTDMEPTATSTLSGTVSGLLVFDVPFGGTAGYYYLNPQTTADAPITNLVAGM